MIGWLEEKKGGVDMEEKKQKGENKKNLTYIQWDVLANVCTLESPNVP